MGSKVSDGKYNPNNLVVGRGRLYISRVSSTTAKPVGGYRDLGNITEFQVTVEGEDLEHFSSRSGIRQVDQKIRISQNVNLSFRADEINLQNLALFLSGSQDTRAQGALAIAGNDNVAVVDKGRWYDLFDVADMASGGYPQGNRAFAVSAVVVEPAGGGTPFTLGTDYELDLVMGRIFIPVTSTIPAGTLGSPTLLDVDFTGAVLTVERVRGVTVADQEFALKFHAENPVDGNHLLEVQIHSVTLNPDGDFALISDEFTSMGFTGAAQKREQVDAASPTMTLETYATAQAA